MVSDLALGDIWQYSNSVLTKRGFCLPLLLAISIGRPKNSLSKKLITIRTKNTTIAIIIFNSQEGIIRLYEGGSNHTATGDSCKAGLRCEMSGAGLGSICDCHYLGQQSRDQTRVCSPVELQAPAEGSQSPTFVARKHHVATSLLCTDPGSWQHTQPWVAFDFAFQSSLEEREKLSGSVSPNSLVITSLMYKERIFTKSMIRIGT